MDEEILEEAGRLVDSKDRAVERLMEDLQETRRRLDEDARRIAELRAEAEAAARVQRELAERLAGAEKETRKTVRKKLTDELLRARAEVQSVVQGIKTDKRLIKAREAKERLQAIEQAIHSSLAQAGDYRPVEDLRAGDRVEIMGLGTVGVLQENPSGKKRVRIRLGEAEMSVEVSRLAGLADAVGEGGVGAPSRGRQARSPRQEASAAEPEVSGVLDVRGKTADEALDALVGGLDQAALAGTPQVRVIHGHGTGRLKQVLREYLKGSPYVAAFRPGERAEGGDGVTVVNLR